MKLLRKFRKGTNNRMRYFLVNLARYCTPRIVCQLRLNRTLRRARRRDDWEYISQRVDYYCRLLPETQLVDEGARTLGEFRFKGHSSVYFFDAYEYVRWFPKRLRWHYLFGDVTKVPEVPSILKSRPIHQKNANSVLLNLEKVRHFTFIKDRIPFRKKMDRAIFQLAINYKPHRIRFVERYFGHPMCDVGIISPLPEYPPEWTKPKITIYEHLHHKFILTLEGIDVATNLKWVMSSNSLPVMPAPTYETWFMEGTLIPDYHYVEIKPDYSDLPERLQYYIDHPDQAEQIVRNAHVYIEQFRNRNRERIISLLVLDKYFRATGQY